MQNGCPALYFGVLGGRSRNVKIPEVKKNWVLRMAIAIFSGMVRASILRLSVAKKQLEVGKLFFGFITALSCSQIRLRARLI